MPPILQTIHNDNWGPSGLISSVAVDIDVTEDTNRDTIHTQARAALTQLRAYVNLANPTVAQTVAATKINAQVNIALIRLVTNLLDATG